MTPNLKDTISNELEFRRIKGKQVVVNFEGGKITSDAGIISKISLIFNKMHCSKLQVKFNDRFVRNSGSPISPISASTGFDSKFNSNSFEFDSNSFGFDSNSFGFDSNGFCLESNLTISCGDN